MMCVPFWAKCIKVQHVTPHSTLPLAQDRVTDFFQILTLNYSVNFYSIALILSKNFNTFLINMPMIS
jgi:hypothetical protein